MCVITLAGCGKPKISSECTLNGRGDAACIFKNTGNAKGSICEFVKLIPLNDEVKYFYGEGVPQSIADKNNLKEKFKSELDSDLKNAKVEEPISPELIDLFLNSKDGIMSTTEICSGIVEAGDIRKSEATMRFRDNLSPAEICVSARGGPADAAFEDMCRQGSITDSNFCKKYLIGNSWTDRCGFTNISKEEVISSLKANLKK